MPRDPVAFRDYYESTHLNLVAHMPGLRASCHAFDLDGVGAASPYFCVWQGDFDSKQAMSDAMNSTQGGLVAADVANYATGGCTLMHYEVLGGGSR